MELHDSPEAPLGIAKGHLDEPMDIHSRLQTADFVVLGIYAVTIVGIGMWVSYRRRAADDLFLAGRSFGWPNMGLSIFGTNISPSALIGTCGVAYTTGMVTANFEWLAWWFLMLLAMLFIPYYLTTQVSTMPEFMRRRFGESIYGFFSWYALFSTIVLWLGGGLYAGGLLLGQIMNWPLWVSVLALTAVATSFTVAGGLAAVIVTDAIQSILMIVGAAAMTLIALAEVGSIERLVHGVPESYWQLIRPPSDPKFPWPALVVGYPVMGIWFWCTDQTIVQRVLAARDVRQGQLACVFTGFLKILPPFLFLMPGILCRILHPGLDDPDTAFVTMVVHHLPAGMIGLIVAVLIAALISTLDSGLNSFSTIFTLDIYVQRFRPAATPREVKWMGRLATVGAAAIAVFCALAMDTVARDLFNLFQSLIAFAAPPMAAVFLIGVLWKRATGTAALSTLVLGSAVSLSLGACHLKDWPHAAFWPHYLFVSFYLFAGISLFMIVASLLTRHSPDEERLPTLKETYARQGKKPTLVWILWGVLALVMLALYIVFD
jgi:SSS family solute:Na+ symporter